MLNIFLGKSKKSEKEPEETPISHETQRIQAQLIREFNSGSFNLHLAISNGMTITQIKNENLKNIFQNSKEMNCSEKYKKPKSKFWFLTRAQSDSQMPPENEYMYDDLSD